MNHSKLTQIIVEGHFSKNGNFIGINHRNEAIYVAKYQIDSLNLNSNGDIKFPLFALGKIEVYPRLTGTLGSHKREIIINKDGVNETFERLTAYAVYADFDSLIEIFTWPISLNLSLIKGRERIAESAGLPNLITPATNATSLDIIKNSYIEAEEVFREYFEYKISVRKKKS
jgi:hypothetical protein